MSDISNQRFGARALSWREGKMGGLVWRIGSIVLLLIAGGAIALGGERLLGGGAVVIEQVQHAARPAAAGTALRVAADGTVLVGEAEGLLR